MSKFRLCIAALFYAVISVSGANAQSTTLPFGGAAYDASLPVEISADSFRVSQAGQSAEFEGNVLVEQGTLRLSAGKVVIEYQNENSDNRGQIERLSATKGVTLVVDDQAAEADTAIYSIDTGNIEMHGNVLLTQGQNAISGQTLTIDLASGSAEMSGRVKTIFKTETSN